MSGLDAGEDEGESSYNNEEEREEAEKKITYTFVTYQYAINLTNGDIDGWDFQWHNPEKHFILAIDYLNY